MSNCVKIGKDLKSCCQVILSIRYLCGNSSRVFIMA